MSSASAPPVDGWRDQVAAYLAREAKPVEKYGHQPRLYALTCQIAAEYPGADDDVLYAAAWLHDLGVFVGHRPEAPEALALWNNVTYALDQVPQLLDAFGFPGEKLGAVLACIRDHQPHADPVSLEASILRDADMLEQLGAIGILRTVVKVGRDTRFHTFTDAVATLTRALESLPSLLRLPASQRLAEERIRLHRAFLHSVAEESQGLLF